MDINKIRSDFPILNNTINDEKIVYFDSAATSLTPKVVTNKIVEYYEKYNANYSRGVSTISNNLTIEIEKIRQDIADFFKVKDSKNVVFTKNSTESINIISNGLINYFKPGDEIVLTEQEHHANILPWINLAKKTGAIIKYIPIKKDGTLEIDCLKNLLNKNTKLVSINHISSTLGYVNDIKSITKKVRELTNAFVVIDGAQSAGHIDVDLSFEPDAFVCSAHKMLGPTGVGVLVIKDSFSNFVEPLNFGGQMVDVASKKDFSVKGLPFKYEAGTLNLAGIFGFGAAINYINALGINNIEKYLVDLTKYFNNKIKDVSGVKIFNDLNRSHGIISINLSTAHSHEVSSDLDKFGIQTRAGSHCSQIYFATQDQDNNVRISLYIYNTFEEIDLLVEKIKEITSKWNETIEKSDEQFNILEELKKLKQMRK